MSIPLDEQEETAYGSLARALNDARYELTEYLEDIDDAALNAWLVSLTESLDAMQGYLVDLTRDDTVPSDG